MAKNPAETPTKQIENKRKRGRPPGSKNKSTKELEFSFKKHDGDALKALLSVCRQTKNLNARINAANSILDRGHGRPRQAVVHSGSIDWKSLTVQQLEEIANSEE